MNKKTFAALALSNALFTNIYAGSCQINSGAYVGLSVGGAHLSGKNEFQLTNIAAGTNNSIKNGLSNSSFAGSIFAGYGLRFNCVWGAVELFYQFDKLNDKATFILFNGEKSIQSKSTNSWGGAANIGYVANNNCIVYVILGAESRRFKVKFSDDANPKDISASIDKGFTSTAFTPGLGVRVMLSKNLSLRTEYKYAQHRKKTLEETAANAALGNDTIAIKHAPVIHSFNLGLVYSF